MNLHRCEPFCIFRNIGSAGLIIFERDNTLLKRKASSDDLMLGEIDKPFVEKLKQFRALNYRFGFVSDQRGVDAHSSGSSEAAGLIGMLDQLLRIDGAVPDFWMACAPLRPTGETQHRRDRQRESNISMISQLIEWYGVDKKACVFVCSSSEAIRAAEKLQVIGIQYSGWPINARGETLSRPSPARVTHLQQLGSKIDEIVGLRHRRTA